MGFLALAIASEVAATCALKVSAGLTRPVPALLVFAGYALAFFALGQSLRVLPVGIAYALWAGVGTAAVAVAGWALYGEALGAPALLGITLIVAGASVLGLSAELP